MAFKFKGSLSAVDAYLKGGIVFDNENLSNTKNMPEGKFTINNIDKSTTDLAQNTLVTNFGKNNEAGMFSFNTGDWKDTDSAPVKLMMRVTNGTNDSDWVTVFDSSKTTVTWSSVAAAGQIVFTVPNLDFKKAIIYINGVLQYPGISYNTFGGTVTFSDKLNIGDQIYIIVGEDLESTDNSEYISSASNNQTIITLPSSKSNNFVYINGVFQYPSKYTVSNDTITLSTGLYLNDNILVLSNNESVQYFESTAVQDQTSFTLTGTFNEGMVFINGILQYDNSYSIIGSTLSFISPLDVNDEVLVVLNDPKFIDSVNTSYTSTISDSFNSNKINIPYFHFSELQVFINGILQNPDSGAYTLNGTEITLSSPLQDLDDIHVIVYNSPVQSDNFVTKAELTSYASSDELNYLKTALATEGINLKWQPHLPSIEVAFGLPRRSLKIWETGSTSTVNNYWLYPVDGTVWTGIGTLGTTPNVPFYKLDSNKDVITWTYTAASDNISTIFVPYTFGTINIFINGVLQSIELGHYTYSGQYITLNGSLSTGDNLIAVLGKLVFNTNPYATQNDLTNYALKSVLSSNDGSSNIGTTSGLTVEKELQIIKNELDPTLRSDLLASNGFENIGNFFSGEGYSSVGNINQSVYERLYKRGEFEIHQMPGDPAGIAGIVFGGANNKAAIIIDERGRLQTYSIVDGKLSAAQISTPIIQGTGYFHNGFEDKIIRFPSAGNESDDLSPYLLITTNDNGIIDIFVGSPNQFNDLGYPTNSSIDKQLFKLVKSYDIGNSIQRTIDQCPNIENTSSVIYHLFDVNYSGSGTKIISGIISIGNYVNYTSNMYMITFNPQNLQANPIINKDSIYQWLKFTSLHGGISGWSDKSLSPAIGLVNDYNNKIAKIYIRIPAYGQKISFTPLNISNTNNTTFYYNDLRNEITVTEPNNIIYSFSEKMLTDRFNVVMNNGEVRYSPGTVVRVSGNMTNRLSDKLADGLFSIGGTYHLANKGREMSISVTNPSTGQYIISGCNLRGDSWKICPPIGFSENTFGLPPYVVNIVSQGTNTFTIEVKNSSGTLVNINGFDWLDLHVQPA